MGSSVEAIPSSAHSPHTAHWCMGAGAGAAGAAAARRAFKEEEEEEEAAPAPLRGSGGRGAAGAAAFVTATPRAGPGMATTAPAATPATAPACERFGMAGRVCRSQRVYGRAERCRVCARQRGAGPSTGEV
jgi:hypothetical protein